MSEKIQLTLTPDQARAVSDSLDLYSRICSGQLEEIASMVRHQRIPMFCESSPGSSPRFASAEVCNRVEDLMKQFKASMGYLSNSHHGVGHPHNPVAGMRAYEIRKVLEKALAEHHNPDPIFRGLSYDGLGPRYTNDPEPEAAVLVIL